VFRRIARPLSWTGEGSRRAGPQTGEPICRRGQHYSPRSKPNLASTSSSIGLRVFTARAGPPPHRQLHHEGHGGIPCGRPSRHAPEAAQRFAPQAQSYWPCSRAWRARRLEPGAAHGGDIEMLPCARQHQGRAGRSGARIRSAASWSRLSSASRRGPVVSSRV
jgi:hypothetical protein